jgi:hypothetical protein
VVAEGLQQQALEGLRVLPLGPQEDGAQVQCAIKTVPLSQFGCCSLIRVKSLHQIEPMP